MFERPRRNGQIMLDRVCRSRGFRPAKWPQAICLRQEDDRPAREDLLNLADHDSDDAGQIGG